MIALALHRGLIGLCEDRLYLAGIEVALRGTSRALFGCVIHAMSVHDFTACRSSISGYAGQGFHAMSVQCLMACRSSS